MNRVTLSVLALIAAPAAAQWSPPAVINPAAFGAPTFRDDFDTLDAGPDMTAKTAKHRWRTVTKDCYGWTPLAATVHDCRTAGREGVYSDASMGINPFRVKDGKAFIDIKPLPAALAKRWGRGFSTGWLSTKFSFAQRYGYWEVSAALPNGAGMWPAIWLMPTTGQWPVGGEIDIMEALGIDSVFYASIHARPDGKALHSTKVIVKSGVNLVRQFHKYSAAWTPTEIVYYFDRKEVRRIATPADMTQPMYLILNVAAGGSWGGPMKAKSGRMAVDYVRVWSVPE